MWEIIRIVQLEIIKRPSSRLSASVAEKLPLTSQTTIIPENPYVSLLSTMAMNSAQLRSHPLNTPIKYIHLNVWIFANECHLRQNASYQHAQIPTGSILATQAVHRFRNAVWNSELWNRFREVGNVFFFSPFSLCQLFLLSGLAHGSFTFLLYHKASFSSGLSLFQDISQGCESKVWPIK